MRLEGYDAVRKDIYQLSAMVESLANSMPRAAQSGASDASTAELLDEYRSVLLRLVDSVIDYCRGLERGIAFAKPGDVRNTFEKCISDLDRAVKPVGLERIAPSPGDRFDDKLHEAKGFDAQSAEEEGTVSTVLEWGFRFGHRVVRPAQVLVAGSSFPAAEKMPAPRPSAKSVSVEFGRLADAANKNSGGER